MKRYIVTGKVIGFMNKEVLANTPEEAAQAFEDEVGYNPSLCWECSRELETGDMFEIEVTQDSEVVLTKEV